MKKIAYVLAMTGFVAFGAGVAESAVVQAEPFEDLPILQCTLTSENPIGSSGGGLYARGNIIMRDVLDPASDGTMLGLIPALGFANFPVTGAVYGYQLSSGEVHTLLQVFLDGEPVKSHAFDLATDTNPTLETQILGIPVTLRCMPRY